MLSVSKAPLAKDRAATLTSLKEEMVLTGSNSILVSSSKMNEALKASLAKAGFYISYNPSTLNYRVFK